jgi:hypothetical protein
MSLRSAGIHRTESWVVLVAGLDGNGKSRPYQGSKPEPSSQLASRYIDYDIPAAWCWSYFHK